jgi:hypothetical protein
VVKGLVLVLALLGLSSLAKADVPNGAACTVNDYYIWVYLETGDGIFPDCSSPEFTGQANDYWLAEYYYPNDEYGQPVEY